MHGGRPKKGNRSGEVVRHRSAPRLFVSVGEQAPDRGHSREGSSTCQPV
ncbi:Hypothetical Protein RSKD131_3577 [Cereibacter sphaeroides KD131]|nr:Hypothetical Protein RSKD131_3577 [Cereibacter sphaeroides KD131]